MKIRSDFYINIFAFNIQIVIEEYHLSHIDDFKSLFWHNMCNLILNMI